jgi:hypothetical protein
MKKKLIITCGIILSIIIVCACFYIPGIVKLNKSVSLLGQGLTLIREGKYDEGLSKCNEMYYREGTCYIVMLGIKLGKNESITKDFCDSIPISDNEPFYMSWILPSRKNYLKNINDAKDSCYSQILS